MTIEQQILEGQKQISRRLARIESALFKPETKFIHADEAAKKFNVTTDWLSKLHSKGKLQSTRGTKKNIRYSIEELDEYFLQIRS